MTDPNQTKIPLLDLSPDELAALLVTRGLPAGRARQILRHIYMHQHDDFAAMPNVGRDLLHMLEAAFEYKRPPIVKEQVSGDGARKFLFALRDGEQIESVLIPEKNHYTLCISSQAGCAQKCLFCLTGKGGLRRNLTQGEIVAQVRDVMKLLIHDGDVRPLTNIVFMGMGEPLDNYVNVLRSINVLTDNNWGLRFAPRRITVSTAGLVPEMYKLGRDTKVNLAVSLNAADDKIRSALMPVNREYPLEVLLRACRDFPLNKGRRIAFEYILIEGVNDSQTDADKLADLLRGVKAKINLIPFNEHAGVAFKRPTNAAVRAFADLMCDVYKYTAMVRYSKGQDISAACGQLKADAVINNFGEII